jgi:hypothetical protein
VNTDPSKAHLSGRSLGIPQCDGQPPASATRGCFLRSCETFQWQVGTYGDCAATCNSAFVAVGTQARSVTCLSSAGFIVPASEATQPTKCGADKPAAEQACTGDQDCYTYSYATTEFGACSEQCGGGVQTRTAKCVNNQQLAVDESKCVGAGIAEPALEKACNTAACETFKWSVQGDWSACNSTCGADGWQTRAVVCWSSGGYPVPDSNCAADDAAAAAARAAAAAARAAAAAVLEPAPSRNAEFAFLRRLVGEDGDDTDAAAAPAPARAVAVAVAAVPPAMTDAKPASSQTCNRVACDPCQAVVTSGRTAQTQSALCEAAGHGTCDSGTGACICTDGWTGGACATQPQCDGVLYNAPVAVAPPPSRPGSRVVAATPPPTPVGEIQCCERATHTLTAGGVCCAKDQVDACGVCNGRGMSVAPDGSCCYGNAGGEGGTDSMGKCCDYALVNKCGVCGGPGTAILDARRTCCVSGVQDKGNVCCASGILDDCGVCDGDGRSCGVQIEIPIAVDVPVTQAPTTVPSAAPTAQPTAEATPSPTVATGEPTKAPTAKPTTSPTATPTATPTAAPTATPTAAPTFQPTTAPTDTPTASPTNSPTAPAATAAPTEFPTKVPTMAPTAAPTPLAALRGDLAAGLGVEPDAVRVGAQRTEIVPVRAVATFAPTPVPMPVRGGAVAPVAPSRNAEFAFRRRLAVAPVATATTVQTSTVSVTGVTCDQVYAIVNTPESKLMTSGATSGTDAHGVVCTPSVSITAATTYRTCPGVLLVTDGAGHAVSTIWCNGRGACDHSSGVCECYAGYGGSECACPAGQEPDPVNPTVCRLSATTVETNAVVANGKVIDPSSLVLAPTPTPTIYVPPAEAGPDGETVVRFASVHMSLTLEGVKMDDVVYGDVKVAIATALNALLGDAPKRQRQRERERERLLSRVTTDMIHFTRTTGAGSTVKIDFTVEMESNKAHAIESAFNDQSSSAMRSFLSAIRSSLQAKDPLTYSDLSVTMVQGVTVDEGAPTLPPTIAPIRQPTAEGGMGMGAVVGIIACVCVVAGLGYIAYQRQQRGGAAHDVEGGKWVEETPGNRNHRASLAAATGPLQQASLFASPTSNALTPTLDRHESVPMTTGTMSRKTSRFAMSNPMANEENKVEAL